MEKEIMNNEEVKVLADKVAEMVIEQLKNAEYSINFKPKQLIKLSLIGALIGSSIDFGCGAASAVRNKLKIRKLKKNAKKNVEQAAKYMEDLEDDYPEEETEE